MADFIRRERARSAEITVELAETMTDANSFLTAADLERLAHEPSSVNRAATAEKIAFAFGTGKLTDQERELAVAIFDILCRDAEVLVRRKLAESLKYHADLPHRIAQQIAFDIAEVAAPMLRHSIVLTDEDLISVIGRCSADHAQSIAQRTYLSGEVTSALVATNDESVVTTLLMNKDAIVSEATYHLIVDTFGGVPRIMDQVSMRAALPFGVIERIVTLVTDMARQRIVSHYGMQPSFVDNLMTHSREHLLLTTALSDATPEEMEDVVRKMHADSVLTPTLVLRALCLGNFVFAAMAMARMAGLPYGNARELLLDPGRRGGDQLYERCNFPPQYKGVFKGVMSLARWYIYTGAKRERGPFQNRVHRWGAETLGVPQNLIGFEQMITKLLTSSVPIGEKKKTH
ncbi:MAG: DUF2336 domain-containing protein [Alphaproteobacteria bacterium]|nr:DUF2336 domain-containing protein [Alphaproteobacteria bacterium]